MSRVRHGPDGSARGRGFRERFLAAGAELRPAHADAAAPYGELILELLAEREHELLMVEAGGRVHARAVVATTTSDPDAAILGLYESVEGGAGDEATSELLAGAEDWAGRRQCKRLLAPVDASTWMAYRFRVPSLDTGQPPGGRSYSWEPHHPARYLERFREAGYEDAIGFETLGLIFPRAGGYRLADAAAQVRPAAEGALAAGFRPEVLRQHQDAVPWEELHELCSRCFAENPLFEPLRLPVFMQLYRAALGAAASDYTHWLRAPDGSVCAVVFAFRQRSAVVVKSIAVSPDHRGLHLSTALIHWILEEAVDAGIDEIVSALVRTGNTSEFLSRRHLMPGVETWSHGFAVVGREVAP